MGLPKTHDTDVEINRKTILAFLDDVPRLEEIGDECKDSGGTECRYRLAW